MTHRSLLFFSDFRFVATDILFNLVLPPDIVFFHAGYKFCELQPWNCYKLFLFLALTSVLTQGSGSAWVTSYKVTWSLDASVWTSILDDFNVEVTFSGNSDASSQVENDLPYGLLATHLRVNPQTWQDSIAMRIDVYGCSFSGWYCDYWDDVISRHTVKNCFQVNCTTFLSIPSLNRT